MRVLEHVSYNTHKRKVLAVKVESLNRSVPLVPVRGKRLLSGEIPSFCDLDLIYIPKKACPYAQGYFLCHLHGVASM